MRNQKRSFARKFIAPLAAAFVASFSIAGLAVEIDGGYSNVFVLNNDLTRSSLVLVGFPTLARTNTNRHYADVETTTITCDGRCGR